MPLANDTDRLAGRRVLVVGASSGIGRVIGDTLCAAGAHVAYSARRLEMCQEAATESGGTAIGVGCDVTDEEQCQRVVAETVAGLGGLDDLVYSAGAISLVALATADAGWWRRTFETNVMGAALVTKAALPHLQESTGTAVYLSSVSSVGAVWPGIGVYTSTKAALNRMIETWRSEHPEVGFTRILVGPTGGGGAGGGAQFDMSAMEHMARWAGLGVQSGALGEAQAVADAVRLVLNEETRITDVTVVPKDPALPWGMDNPADELSAL
jgi:NAD(P)-dependent dehydrogenase (short-subunit alcohol dehydrogenase family)